MQLGGVVERKTYAAVRKKEELRIIQADEHPGVIGTRKNQRQNNDFSH
jgi:hypothetical protein